MSNVCNNMFSYNLSLGNVWKQLDELRKCSVLASCLSMFVWQKCGRNNYLDFCRGIPVTFVIRFAYSIAYSINNPFFKLHVTIHAVIAVINTSFVLMITFEIM